MTHHTLRYPSPPQNYPKNMHTNTFLSRFKVGDKITDGTTTFTITKIAIDAHSAVYYKTDKRTYPEERNLTNYRLAPKYSPGDKVWVHAHEGVMETIVNHNVGTRYALNKQAYCREEHELFPTAETCLASIKIIPLN